MNVKKCVRALLCLYLTLIIAMDAVKAQTLKVGDSLPPELWTIPLDVINHPEGKDCITLGEYKDKLIILDFWATWCSPCIAMLPEQDSLQKQFKDQIQILPVTYQTGEEVSIFMEKFNRRMKYKNALPKVVADEAGLHKAFPHTYLPHYVWIDGSGTVKAITGYQDINAEKINAFLKSEQVSLTAKEDPARIPFNKSLPFLIEGNGSNGQALLYHSIVTGHTEGLSGGYSINVDSLGNGKLLLLNSSPFWLFRVAYGADSLWINANRIEVNLQEPRIFSYNSSYGSIEEWLRTYSFCYQLLLQKTTREHLFSTLAEDLKRIFPDIQASMQEREKQCWVLSRISGVDIPYSCLENQKAQIEPDGYTLENAPLKTFVLDMNMMILPVSPLPLIDETEISGHLDIRLNADLKNMEDLALELERYGFRLTKEYRKISVLVINDKPDAKL